MKIKIGLIDSGVNTEDLCKDNVTIIDAWKGKSTDFRDKLGHGTMCANLILEMITSDVELYNIKVFDKTLSTTSKIIINAIEYCILNDINVINLSVSINNLDYYYEFKTVCDYANRSGIIIIASADNMGNPCIPAYINSVLGVGAAMVKNRNDFYFSDSSIQIYGDGSLPNTIKSKILPYSTSFATARVCGMICQHICNVIKIDFNELKLYLKENSKSYVKEKIYVHNLNIDFDKCTSSIDIIGNKETIVRKILQVDKCHIIKNEIPILLLMNITNDINYSVFMNKFIENLSEYNSAIFYINLSNMDVEPFSMHSETIYKQLPLEICTAYAKTIINNINCNELETKLIIIGLDKPIVPNEFVNYNFFSTYTVTEISLLFGFNPDDCIIVIDELTKYEFIKKNLDCLKGLFNTSVSFIIYNSLNTHLAEKYFDQNISDLDIYRKKMNKLVSNQSNSLHDDLGLNIYNLNDNCDIIRNYICELLN